MQSALVVHCVDLPEQAPIARLARGAVLALTASPAPADSPAATSAVLLTGRPASY